MGKFIKFCKKPLTIVSAVVTGVFLIALIVVLCVPHGTKYVYEKTLGTVTTRQEMTFKDDKLYVSTYKNEVALVENQEISYKIEDGKLIMIGTELDINSRKIVYSFDREEIVYTCCLTQTIMIVSIVMSALGALALAGSIVVTMLDKNGKLSKKSA